MTGVEKSEFSPKKGKENKNLSNLPRPSLKVEHLTNENKTQSKECTKSQIKGFHNDVINDIKKVVEENNSTSKRSVRPQTKVLRRPTPNLQHPVILNDSDDSSCSEKSKDENPKRLKTSDESSSDASSPSTHKTKNFIMYNKHNVEKNTKQAIKDRNSANLSSSIPNPCTSCNRSQAPERLHSHAKKDSRGLMFRRSPVLNSKLASPQKKVAEIKHKDYNDRIEDTVSDVQIKEIEQTDTDESVRELSIKKCNKLTRTKSLEELERACYICRENFRISALLLHESKCLENWKKINNSLTPNLRKLPPRRPEVEIETISDSPPSEEADDLIPDTEWSEVQSQLEPCPVCGRTFFPERLPIHRRVCKGKPSPKLLKRATSLREKSVVSLEEDENQTVAMYLPCEVCGRNFGSWVISVHQQQCLKKSKKETSVLDQIESEKSSGTCSDEDVASLVELGDDAWVNHLQQLLPCPMCARTFFPDRLEIHKRSCKGPPAVKRPGSNRGT